MIGESGLTRRPMVSVELILREDPSDPDDRANGKSTATLRVALFKNRDPGGFRTFAGVLRRL